MMSPSGGGEPVRHASNEDTADKIEWSVFLLEKNPGRGVMALAVVAFTAYFVWSLMESAWLTGVSVFILIASLSTFFFPTRFRLDAETVAVRNLFYWRTRKWSEFRGMRRNGDKIKLVTFTRDSRLDNYRGMLIMLPEDDEAVLDFIRLRLKEREHEPAEQS
ncbi:MAG: hypothetical protein GY835_00835 [bacterium]|nr:hypothetical protein [bacterium]